MNTNKKDFDVGDWVYLLDTGKLRKWFNGHKWVGKVVQITNDKYLDRLNGRKSGEGILDKDNKIGINFSADMIRPATPEEIAIAQGSTSEWKVGEELRDEFLDNTDIRYGCKGTSKYIPCHKGGWGVRKVAKVVDGWANISNTSSLWLPPKHLCTSLPTDSSAEEIYHIGQWIEILSTGCRCSGEVGKGMVLMVTEITAYTGMVSEGITKKYTLSNGAVISSRKGCTKVVNEARVPFTTTVTEQVPVTEDNVYVGMKVVRGKDWDWGDQDGGAGNEGEIVKALQNNWHQVKWSNGVIQNYRTGNNNKYDLYIAPSNSKTINNNNQSISSQIKTKSNVNTEQKIKYTGAVICSIVSQIRQPEDRRESGISGRNSRSLIRTGNQ